MMLPLGLALAALIGLSLGLLGGGGSILTVPIFVYVLGYEPKAAIAMTLLVVGATSVVGAVGHWRAGHVNLRVAFGFGAVAMAGAYGGARLAAALPGALQLAILGVVMLVAAAAMFRGRAADDAAHPRRALPVVLGAAAGVGLLTGIVGIGGGFLIVPALVLLASLPMKEAVGTSLVVIAMNAAAGYAGYAGQVAVPWGFLALFTTVAVAGILAGTRLVQYVSQRQLRRGFAVFLVAMAVLVLYQNHDAFTPARAPATAHAGR